MQVKSALNGKEINLTSDNTVIKSTNFNVDKSGKVSCSDISITGGSVNVQDTGSNNSAKIIANNTNTGDNTRIISLGLLARKNNNNNTGVYYADSFSIERCGNGGSQVTEHIWGSVEDGDVFLSVKNKSNESIIKPDIITTPKLTQTSLETQKKNFEKLENALDIIKDVDIYKYNLKSEEEGTKKHIGFVIGDKYNYSKELTSNENDGVDIYSLASCCLAGIKEQQLIIERLQKEIKNLKEENDEKN